MGSGGAGAGMGGLGGMDPATMAQMFGGAGAGAGAPADNRPGVEKYAE